MPSSHSTWGTDPTASTTTSAASSLPSSSSTRSGPVVPWIAVTGARGGTGRPRSSCRRRASAPTTGPRARTNGSGSGSTTCTSQPSWVAVAATSVPTKPAPRTTTRRPGRSALVEGRRVVHGADAVPPRERRVEGEPPRPDPGGGDEPPVGEDLASRGLVERDGMRVEVGGDDRLAEPPRHVGGAGALAELEDGRVHAVLQRVLGQRWPVVGRVDLPPDDEHRPGVTGGAQLLGRAQPGEPGPDDDDRVGGHPVSRRRPARRRRSAAGARA